MPRTSPIRLAALPHPQRARLSRLLPVAVLLLGALLPACTPPAPAFEALPVSRSVIASPDAEPEEVAPPEPDDSSDDELVGAGQRHRGEEGKMGTPTAKSGLYAQKGPNDPVGLGGLGLVGTGRGGGGYSIGQGPIAPRHAGASHGSPAGDRYAAEPESPWTTTHAAPLSTFSIDVDTASYSNVRRLLSDGDLPPNAAVRVEEMINYFDYAYPPPKGEHPLDVGAEVAPCPWQPGHQLVRVHLQAKTIEPGHVPPRNLVFLVDTSGSMRGEDRLGLIKKGLSLLTAQLRPEDRISLVTYAGDTGVALPSTSGAHKLTILRAIDRLGAGGGTNGGAGIALAYQEARRSFVKGGINRVLLATDGDFNVGITDHDALVRRIEQERETGVSLTVLGVGRGNLNDHLMEQLADHGDGNYAYLDSEAEARKALVAEANGTLVTVAKNVKLQVEWNPGRVAGYRLLGYENRALTAEQFNDDRKDAGELGAGDSVTALYEVVPVGRPVPGAPVDGLKYQHPTDPCGPELLTLKVRYKHPEADSSTKLELAVTEASARWADASPQLRLAAAVAAFGLKLRGSPDLADFDLAAARDWAESAALPDPDGHRSELVRLIDRARSLMDRRVVYGRGIKP